MGEYFALYLDIHTLQNLFHPISSINVLQYICGATSVKLFNFYI